MFKVAGNFNFFISLSLHSQASERTKVMQITKSERLMLSISNPSTKRGKKPFTAYYFFSADIVLKIKLLFPLKKASHLVVIAWTIYQMGNRQLADKKTDQHSSDRSVKQERCTNDNLIFLFLS